jgi:hypothetical protein
MSPAPTGDASRARHHNDPIPGIEILLGLDREILVHLEDSPQGIADA